MKTALVVASVASMIDQFNMNAIDELQNLGYEVSVACNFEIPGNISAERSVQLRKTLDSQGVNCFQIDFARKPFKKDNLKAYIQLKNIFIDKHFDIVHCHSPIGGVLTRLVANKYRKKGTTVVYSAHGFHFFKGAPLKNWLIFFPVEYVFSFLTDVLITINGEDYKRAQKLFHAKKLYYVPGVGIDLKRFDNNECYRQSKREELGIGENEIALLSVGELDHDKNHCEVLEALKEIRNPKLKYFICGIGSRKEEYESFVSENGLSDCVRLLGYRTDIPEVLSASDIFVFPSIFEGLPVALVEAVASKRTVICSACRGNTDVITNPDYLFQWDSVDSLVKVLNRTLEADNSKAIIEQYEYAQQVSCDSVNTYLRRIYSTIKEK